MIGLLTFVDLGLLASLLLLLLLRGVHDALRDGVPHVVGRGRASVGVAIGGDQAGAQLRRGRLHDGRAAGRRQLGGHHGHGGRQRGRWHHAVEHESGRHRARDRYQHAFVGSCGTEGRHTGKTNVKYQRVRVRIFFFICTRSSKRSLRTASETTVTVTITVTATNSYDLQKP